MVGSARNNVRSFAVCIKRACKEFCCMEGVCARVFTGQTYVMIRHLMDLQSSMSALSVCGIRNQGISDLAMLIDHFLRWIKRDAHSFGCPVDLVLSNLKQPMCSRARCAVKEPFYPRLVLGWIPYDFDPIESRIITHLAPVTSVDWKRDKIASASIDGSISIWDASTSSRLLEFRDHKDEVNCVALSNSGDLLASGSKDEQVIIWSLLNEEILHNLEGHTGSVLCVSWSPNSLLLASGSEDGTIIIWNAKSGVMVFRSEFLGSVSSLSWSGDGSSIVSGGFHVSGCCWDPGNVFIWRADDGHKLLQLDAHIGAVIDCKWSPDDSKIATCGLGSEGWGSAGEIYIWESVEGNRLLNLECHSDTVMSVCWSPDSSFIVSGSLDRTASVWDSRTGEQLYTFTGHSGGIHCARWDPLGSFIVAGGSPGDILIWRATVSHNLSKVVGHSHDVSCTSWSPDGTKIATGSYSGSDSASKSTVIPGEIFVWDCFDGKNSLKLEGHSGSVLCLDWSPDGRFIVSGGFKPGPAPSPWESPGEICIWNSQSGVRVATLSQRVQASFVKWSPTGSKIVSGSQYDNPVLVWNALSWNIEHKLVGNSDGMSCACWSPDGKKIVTGATWIGWKAVGCPGEIFVWDSSSGTRLMQLKGHTKVIACLSWSGDGRFISSASDDGFVIVWSAEEGNRISTLSMSGTPCCMEWSDDGGKLVMGMSDGCIFDLNVSNSNLTKMFACSLCGSKMSTMTCMGSRVATRLGNSVVIWEYHDCNSHCDPEWFVASSQVNRLIIGISQGSSFSADFAQNDSGIDENDAEMESPSTEHRLDISACRNQGLISIHDNTKVFFAASACCSADGQVSALRATSQRQDGEDVMSSASMETCQVAAKVEPACISRSDSNCNMRVLSTLRLHDNGGVLSVKWSPNGSNICSSSIPLILWNSRSGKIDSRLSGHNGLLLCVAYSPDGSRIASGSIDHSVIIWSVSTGKIILQFKGHSGWVQGVCWSPDSSKIFSGGKGSLNDRDPGDMFVWDSNTGEKLLRLEGHTNLVLCTSWSPDGKFLVSGANKELFMWDSVTGKRLLEMLGHVSVIKSVCFSPDGTSILSGCWDKTIIVWNAKTGGRERTLLGHSGGVLSVHWSPDGSKIVSSGHSGACSLLGEIFIWMAANGEKLLELKNHPGAVYCVCWSPDSSKFTSSSEDGSVKIWAFEMGASRDQSGMKQRDGHEKLVKRRRLLTK